MTTKKATDNQAINKAMLNMVNDRLNDSSYSAIYPDLIKQKEILERRVKNG